MENLWSYKNFSIVNVKNKLIFSAWYSIAFYKYFYFCIYTDDSLIVASPIVSDSTIVSVLLFQFCRKANFCRKWSFLPIIVSELQNLMIQLLYHFLKNFKTFFSETLEK